jgi:sigma-E factor negative regulatory protein RseC
MMKEWATVISWQDGIANLRCEAQSSCSGCHSSSSCGSKSLNESQQGHQLQLPIAQPLEPGQKVELGITESSLLRSAFLVYMTPLVGLIFGGAILQSWYQSDLYAVIGALLGGGLGFLIARLFAGKWDKQQSYQPVVLQVGLPPTALRFYSEP